MDKISGEFNCSPQQSSIILTGTQIYAPSNKDKTHNICHPLKNYQVYKENITLNEEENKLIKINLTQMIELTVRIKSCYYYVRIKSYNCISCNLRVTWRYGRHKKVYKFLKPKIIMSKM